MCALPVRRLRIKWQSFRIAAAVPADVHARTARAEDVIFIEQYYAESNQFVMTMHFVESQPLNVARVASNYKISTIKYKL